MQTRSVLIAPAALVLLLARDAAAQAVVQSEVVVPIQSVFTVNTTVSVPDRGYTSLGGFRSASRTRNTLRPGFNNGVAERAVAQGATVHAWIHDFDELEAELGKAAGGVRAPAATGFAAAARRYTSEPVADGKAPERSASRDSRTATAAAGDADRARQKARELETAGQFAEAAEQWVKLRDNYAAEIDAGEVARSLARLKDLPGVAAVVNEPRAADFLKRGQEAESSGQAKVARIHYQAAARLAPAPSGQIAHDRLAALEAAVARR